MKHRRLSRRSTTSANYHHTKLTSHPKVIQFVFSLNKSSLLRQKRFSLDSITFFLILSHQRKYNYDAWFSEI